MTEYMRFTIEQANSGLAEGWRLASGWFPFQASYWAWFVREVDDGTTRPTADTNATEDCTGQPGQAAVEHA